MSDFGLFAEERQRIILERLGEDSKVLVQDLSEAFGVSLATIRTDLRELENTGKLIRTHGGAIPVIRVGFEQNSIQKQVSYIEAKQRIANAAKEFVHDGDTIAIDTGTTTYEFARALGQKNGLTVVTNDLVIASYFEETTGFNIIMMGGSVRRGFHCTVGVKALESIHDINVDLAFISANAFNIERGFMTPSIEHAEIKKRMNAIASKSIVLMDSHKIGGLSFYTFAGLADIDVWVTDKGIGKTARAEIEAAEEEFELVIA